MLNFVIVGSFVGKRMPFMFSPVFKYRGNKGRVCLYFHFFSFEAKAFTQTLSKNFFSLLFWPFPLLKSCLFLYDIATFLINKNP